MEAASLYSFSSSSPKTDHFALLTTTHPLLNCRTCQLWCMKIITGWTEEEGSEGGKEREREHADAFSLCRERESERASRGIWSESKHIWFLQTF